MTGRFVVALVVAAIVWGLAFWISAASAMPQYVDPPAPRVGAKSTVILQR